MFIQFRICTNIVEEMGSKYFRFVSVIKCYNFNLYTLDIFDQKDKKILPREIFLRIFLRRKESSCILLPCEGE